VNSLVVDEVHALETLKVALDLLLQPVDQAILCSHLLEQPIPSSLARIASVLALFD